MRIATFNLEDLGGDKQSLDDINARIEALRPQMLRLGADIICLQEVNAKRQKAGVKRGLYAFDRLIEGTPYAPFSWVATSFGEEKQFADKHNLVILSRWPIVEVEQLSNDLISAPTYRSATADPPPGKPAAVEWDRPLLHAAIELGDGRLLHIVNLHLRAPLAVPVEGQKTGAFSWKTTSGWAEGFYLASMKRSGQALETRLLIDGIFDREKDALIMVCGDFNADVRETPTRILCGDIEDTGNGDLAKRMLVPLERRLPESRRYSVIHRGRKHMLDHMLVSRALLAGFQKLDVHNEALGDELVAYAAVGNSPYSYHAPIVAEFNLPDMIATNRD